MAIAIRINTSRRIRRKPIRYVTMSRNLMGEPGTVCAYVAC